MRARGLRGGVGVGGGGWNENASARKRAETKQGKLLRRRGGARRADLENRSEGSAQGGLAGVLAGAVALWWQALVRPAKTVRARLEAASERRSRSTGGFGAWPSDFEAQFIGNGTRILMAVLRTFLMQYFRKLKNRTVYGCEFAIAITFDVKWFAPLKWLDPLNVTV